MPRLNFSGGEPFLHKKVSDACGLRAWRAMPLLQGGQKARGHLPLRLCAPSVCLLHDLALESVSIVSNGSKITGDWIRKHGVSERNSAHSGLL